MRDANDRVMFFLNFYLNFECFFFYFCEKNTHKIKLKTACADCVREI